jgi:hypothetical protein
VGRVHRVILLESDLAVRAWLQQSPGSPTVCRNGLSAFLRQKYDSGCLTKFHAAWQHPTVAINNAGNTFMTRISIHKPTALRRGAVASCHWQVVEGFDAMPPNGPGRAMK